MAQHLFPPRKLTKWQEALGLLEDVKKQDVFRQKRSGEVGIDGGPCVEENHPMRHTRTIQWDTWLDYPAVLT